MHPLRSSCTVLISHRTDKLFLDAHRNFDLPMRWLTEIPHRGLLQLVYFTSARQVVVELRRSLIPQCVLTRHPHACKTISALIHQSPYVLYGDLVIIVWRWSHAKCALAEIGHKYLNLCICLYRQVQKSLILTEFCICDRSGA